MTELLSNLYNTGIHHAAEVDAVYHQKIKVNISKIDNIKDLKLCDERFIRFCCTWLNTLARQKLAEKWP